MKKQYTPGIDLTQTNGAREDTLFLFASSGDGAWDMPGTDSRGYTFDSLDGAEEAGWTTLDKTSQPNNYWHLDAVNITAGHPTDMSGAFAPFTAGDEVNDYALWCGRMDVCGWFNGTGYGNNWDQWLRIASSDFTSSLTLNFFYSTHFEGDVWDHMQVMIEETVGGDMELVEYFDDQTGVVQIGHDESVTITASTGVTYGDVIIRFSTDGAWSDEDGLFVSDIGAIWMDNIELIRDGSTVLQADFENALMPAGITADSPPAAGDYAALYDNLFQEDICTVNNTYCWAFYDLETFNPEYPIPVIAYGPPYIDNDTWSPILDSAHELDNSVGEPVALGAETQVWLYAWIYADLPQNPLIYYSWSVAAQTAELPCISVAKNDNTVYYGDAKQWGAINENVTQYVVESANGGTVVGIAMGLNCVDMYPFWANENGDGTGHTPGPFFDNARLMIINASAVGWDISGFHRFQDNFPEATGSGAGLVRIDSAYNVEPVSSPTVVIGDSTMIELNMDLLGGIALATNPTSGEDLPALYMWFRVIAGPHMGTLDALMADQDDSDGIWSPWAGTETVNGITYGKVQADSAMTMGNWQAGKWAFDYNDEYFEPGDIIELFYRAQAVDGTTECRPGWALSSNPDLRWGYLVRCLPTLGANMLFVNDANGGLTDAQWDEAFRYNGYGNYDKYNVQAPSSGLENGLAGRATLADLEQYDVIVWDSSSLSAYSVCTLTSDKTEDDVLLTNWLSTSDHDTYLWMLGDLIASDLGNGEPFLSMVLGVNLLSTTNYYDDYTGILVPTVYGTHPDLEFLGGEPCFFVDGGCPGIEDFNVVAPIGTHAVEAFAWEEDAGSGAVAGIFNRDPDGNGSITSSGGYFNHVVFNPFGYFHVWDKGYGLPSNVDYARRMVGDVLNNLLNFGPNVAPDAVDDQMISFTRMDGNFPNPFNPTTTIKFSLANAEHVDLAIYDVSGRLVKQLIQGQMTEGPHDVVWNGKTSDGAHAASGVYFYKMNAGDYSATEKMVMLK